jgi:RNA polymerase sigma factor for flagellar operon FliA
VDYSRQLVENLSTIDRVVHRIARRHHLRPQDREDFNSHVREKLIEGDYRILRAYEGLSKLSTYLTTVIGRLFLDYQIQQWGRWRPSAAAQRLGPVAVLLERLTTRDGHSVDEAITIMRVNHRLDVPARELELIWSRLPVRATTRLVREEEAAEVTVPASADILVEQAERVRVVTSALEAALAQLTGAERLLLVLHYDRELPLERLAVLRGVAHSTVHRHVRRIMGTVEAALEAQGVQRSTIRELLASTGVDLPPILRELAAMRDPRVRLTKRDDEVD